MKKTTVHSRSGLFLMEMILSLLILALTSAVCIRIFAAAHSSQKQAREWNHIEELTVSAGEILEGTDGSPEAFLSLMPGGSLSDGRILYFFDSRWKACAESGAAYRFSVTLSSDSRSREAALSFQDPKGEVLYEQTIRFPLLDGRKEAD